MMDDNCVATVVIYDYWCDLYQEDVSPYIGDGKNASSTTCFIKIAGNDADDTSNPDYEPISTVSTYTEGEGACIMADDSDAEGCAGDLEECMNNAA